MSENRIYNIDLNIALLFEGEEIPCEETLILPIKAYIKKHVKAYKKTTRVVVLETNIYESGYEKQEVAED